MHSSRLSPLRLLSLLATALLLAGLFGCDTDPAAPAPSTPTEASSGEEATAWMDLILHQIQEESLSPPRASRVLAYSGVAMYEAVVDGIPSRSSFAGRIPHLELLPNGRAETLDYPTVLHGALAHLLPDLLTTPESHDAIADLAEQRLQLRQEAGVPDDVIQRSFNRGILLAEILRAWAFNDGYINRDQALFSPPDAPWAWVPTAEDQTPMEPFWSTLRPFAMPHSDSCKPPAPIPFSSSSDSDFYMEAFAVWETSQSLTEDQKHIAHFWADDPGITPTPPGHWMAIATQMEADLFLNLSRTVELYALLGVTAADAFISCWDEKYRSYLIRPLTYIQRHIDPHWETLINTPPFPEYTSGHSNVSGASARILTELLGSFPFEDRTHAHRGLGTRHFEHFEHAATESARSRLYGGIHYPMGIDHGLPQGECVADFVLRTLHTP